jgi:hypothetical protein
MVIVTGGVGLDFKPLSSHASQQACERIAHVLELRAMQEYGNDPWTHFTCAKLEDTHKVR